MSKKRDSRKASIVKDTADVMGVSERTVYRTIEGANENEQVFSTYMFLHEGRNLLLEAVKNVLPPLTTK